MAPATPAATIHSTTATQPPSSPFVTKMTNPAPPSNATTIPARGPARTPARTENRSPRPLGTPRYALSDAPANAMATATCTAHPSSRAAEKDRGRPLGRREDRIGGHTVRAALPVGRALHPAPGRLEDLREWRRSVSRFGVQDALMKKSDLGGSAITTSDTPCRPMTPDRDESISLRFPSDLVPAMTSGIELFRRSWGPDRDRERLARPWAHARSPWTIIPGEPRESLFATEGLAWFEARA